MNKQKRTMHLSKNSFAESLGWIGAIAILGSYFLLSLGFISGESTTYHALVLIGSVGLAIITYRHRAFQSFIVNVIYSLLAVIALVRLFMLA